MLLHLAIKNFAIIKSTEIDFSSGMTVLTGDTGAGKSILLDALSFVLGARLEKAFLQEDQVTEVSATFCIKENTSVQKLLSELFIDHESECTFRRVVNTSKQSRLFINGSVVRASDMHKISDKLINIYSQNSHQDLLDPKSQLSLLDGFGNHDKLLLGVKSNFNELNDVKIKIQELQKIVDNQNSEKELLEYKLNELLELELFENEFEGLASEHQNLSSVDDIGQCLNSVISMMYEDDNNLISQLSYVEKELNNFANNTSFDTIRDLISQAKVYTQETISEANNIADGLEHDPEKLANVEARMTQIYDLARKHKVEPSYLYNYTAELQAELDSFSQDSEELESLYKLKEELTESYIAKATILSDIRKKSAKDFSKQVQEHIRTLNIPKGSFEAIINPSDNYTSNGIDSCEFMINFNLGEKLAPVKKVASGGELSRIGLSIQAVSAEKRSFPTLVFDEVDVGISGATAEIVGKLLKGLSKKLQVLCITHQAQVAAQGDIHLHVSKEYLKDTTESKIIQLDGNQRIQEIAKIVGGVDISENTLNHARDLLGV